MSDRLKDLQRQRALALEQLAWLDREIAAAGGTPVAPGSAVPSNPIASSSAPAAIPLRPVLVNAAVTVSPSTTSSNAMAEDIIAQYQTKGTPVRDQVRRGCFLYFFAALVLVGLGVIVLYFISRRS